MKVSTTSATQSLVAADGDTAMLAKGDDEQPLVTQRNGFEAADQVFLIRAQPEESDVEFAGMIVDQSHRVIKMNQGAEIDRPKPGRRGFHDG